MPRGDLVAPPAKGPTERADLGRVDEVAHVLSEAVDERERERERGVGVRIELAHRLFGMPCRGDLTPRVSGTEQPQELGPTVLLEALVGHGEQAPAAIEGVDLTPAVSERLVLDASAALIQLELANLTT
jgi:hypothetical protein